MNVTHPCCAKESAQKQHAISADKKPTLCETINLVVAPLPERQSGTDPD